MKINRGGITNFRMIWSAIFVIVVGIAIDFSFVSQLEDSKRQQARCNLEHTIQCLGKLDKGQELDGIYKICTNKMRTSLSGDMYIIDFFTKMFIYDNSYDIPKDQQLYFTEDSIGGLFKDWHSAEKALEAIVSGNDSNHNSKTQYNFDGSTEWLEYKIYQPTNGNAVVVVQGIQKDEVLDGFNILRILTGIFMMILSIYFIVLSSKECEHDN